MILHDDIELYHGSYTVVENLDISKCAAGKDFGKGFYVTTNPKQAEKFVKSSVGKALKNGAINSAVTNGYVSIYKYHKVKGVMMYEFTDADKEWLHCVAAHRKSGILLDELDKWDKYDIIVGKIANDNTNQVITAYINGTYGPIGSDVADNTAINLLLPQKLTDQICFRNAKALETVAFLNSYEQRI